MNEPGTRRSELGRLTGWVNNAGIERPTTARALVEADLRAIVRGQPDRHHAGLRGRHRGDARPRRSRSSTCPASTPWSGFPESFVYAATKGGIDALTRQLAVEEGPHGIRCTAVRPGAVRTPLTQSFLDAADDPAALLAEYADLHPIRRLIEPVEVARVVAFLLSDEASLRQRRGGHRRRRRDGSLLPLPDLIGPPHHRLRRIDHQAEVVDPLGTVSPSVISAAPAATADRWSVSRSRTSIVGGRIEPDRAAPAASAHWGGSRNAATTWSSPEVSWYAGCRWPFSSRSGWSVSGRRMPSTSSGRTDLLVDPQVVAEPLAQVGAQLGQPDRDPEPVQHRGPDLGVELVGGDQGAGVVDLLEAVLTAPLALRPVQQLARRQQPGRTPQAGQVVLGPVGVGEEEAVDVRGQARRRSADHPRSTPRRSSPGAGAEPVQHRVQARGSAGADRRRRVAVIIAPAARAGVEVEVPLDPPGTGLVDQPGDVIVHVRPAGR